MPRKLAQRWRKVAAEGRDPVKEREAEARAARREDISLAVITADAFETRKAELKGDGKAGRWLSLLERHVLPKLGKVPVTDLDQRDIRDTLAPIWHTKTDTARKAMNRLSIVMKHAAALGLDVDLQATDKAKALLEKSRHVPRNIPAMNWRDVPEKAAEIIAAAGYGRQKAGWPISSPSFQMAVTALAYGAAFATGTLADLENCDVEVVSAWNQTGGT